MGQKTKNRPDLEQRVFNFEIRAEQPTDGEYILTGRPIVYNSITDIGYFSEIIDSGALDAADLTDVRFLVNHDISKIPLARSRRNNGNSTMQFSIDAEGMLLDWVKLDCDNNAEARALWSAVGRGDISGMSFMFGVAEDRWENLDSDHPTRHIMRISTVIEVSACTFPAYDDTEIHARSLRTLENARNALENARRNALPPEGGEIDLLKAKTKILGGIRK